MSYYETLKAQRTDILSAASRHGARNVRIFGSSTREDFTPDSDVDFLVEMDAGRSLFDLVDLMDDLETLLHREVDVVSERGLSPYLKDKILAEARPL